MFAVLKTITYGIMHICVATTLAYAISGNFKVALSIGLLEPLIQTVFFYMHEKAWDKQRSRFELQPARINS